MADLGAGVRQRQPNIPDVAKTGTQSDINTTSSNTPNNEWANYQRTGWWAPNYPPEKSGTYRDSPAREYVQSLRRWQNDYMNYLNYTRWTQMMLPYTISCMQMQQFHLQQQIQQQHSQASQGRRRVGRGINLFNPFAVGVGRIIGQQQQRQNGAVPQARVINRAAQPDATVNGREYIVPSLWKRIIAEFVDFLFLFMIKLGVTLLTVEYGGILDLEKYDLEVLFNQDIDYDRAFAMTSELIIMEIINRVFICIFETLCLNKGVANQIGGATPGKRLMGLRVVSCSDIIETGPNRVRVAPAGNIGFTNALVRSVIKNFSMAFFFPACFTVFFFQHNRAAYDVIANSMVVELSENDIRMGL